MKGKTSVPRDCRWCYTKLPLPRRSGTFYHKECIIEKSSIPPKLRPDYDVRLAYNRAYLHELRKIVLIHYGGRCFCCGESQQEFLVIDHINGGGSKHRKEMGLHGDKFYRYLKQMNFPEGYRVLCQNCNASLGHYGYCPHQGGNE